MTHEAAAVSSAGPTHLAELKEQGLIDDSGLTRPSPSGCKAVVWRALP